MVAFGWLATALVNIITLLPGIGKLGLFYAASYAGVFVNTSIACNWLIYYYRR